MNRSILALLPLLAATVAADEIHLRGGGKIVGQIVQETHDAVVIEVGPGRITLPAERVDHIVARSSPLSVYNQRAANLALSDVDGWLDAGLYAQRHGLTTQARAAFERVLAYSPENPIAQAALGNVMQGAQQVVESKEIHIGALELAQRLQLAHLELGDASAQAAPNLAWGATVAEQ